LTPTMYVGSKFYNLKHKAKSKCFLGFKTFDSVFELFQNVGYAVTSL